MLDTILKMAALVTFVATLSVLVIYVPDLDLVAVLIIVIVMVVYDFLVRPLLVRNDNNHRR